MVIIIVYHIFEKVTRHKETQFIDIKSTMFQVKDKGDCICNRLDFTEENITDSIHIAIKMYSK